MEMFDRIWALSRRMEKLEKLESNFLDAAIKAYQEQAGELAYEINRKMSIVTPECVILKWGDDHEALKVAEYAVGAIRIGPITTQPTQEERARMVSEFMGGSSKKRLKYKS